MSVDRWFLELSPLLRTKLRLKLILIQARLRLSQEMVLGRLRGQTKISKHHQAAKANSNLFSNSSNHRESLT